MGRRPLHRALTTALVVAAAAASAGQAPSPRQVPPTDQRRFQSGIDLVLVDVTVLGRDGAPLATLDPADFTLMVDGQARLIHSVRLVRAAEAAPRASAAGAGMATAALPAEGRSFVLVIDREHIPVGEGQQMLAAAARFVDSLAPGDRVALWTSALTASTLSFSEGRDAITERIRLAVGTYRASFGPWNIGRDEAVQVNTNPGGVYAVVDRLGMSSTFPLALKPVIERECFRQPDSCPQQVHAQAQEIARDARARANMALANLGSLVDALVPLDGPKHIVLVTGGPVLTTDSFPLIAALGARAALARVTIHALQVRDPGYQARPDQMRAAPEEIDQSQSVAYALAGMTGGDRWAPSGAAVAEFVPPQGTQAPASQAPAQTPPPAQAQPPQTPQPSPAAPSAAGGTTSTAGDRSLASPAAQRAVSSQPGVDAADLTPSIVELESLVDIDVTYRPEANSGIWMPVKMTEVYEGPIPLGTRAPVRGRAVGQASYSDFKRFETSVKIVVPR
jgi:VWFA-related protein